MIDSLLLMHLRRHTRHASREWLVTLSTCHCSDGSYRCILFRLVALLFHMPAFLSVLHRQPFVPIVDRNQRLPIKYLLSLSALAPDQVPICPLILRLSMLNLTVLTHVPGRVISTCFSYYLPGSWNLVEKHHIKINLLSALSWWSILLLLLVDSRSLRISVMSPSHQISLYGSIGFNRKGRIVSCLFECQLHAEVI